MRICVTGSSGHLGRALSRVLPLDTIGFDLPLDVLSESLPEADFCIHLAGLKYADRAEVDPFKVAQVNIMGTQRVVDAYGSNVVLASTCKAADPETVYGASKLIAERIVLNAGGRVVRLVNVLGSAGSVTDIWRDVPEDEPIPVTNCTRLFMELQDAVSLLAAAIDYPPGLYAPARWYQRHMDELAAELYPGRAIKRIPRRRGDRQRERLLAVSEHYGLLRDHALRIIGPHTSPVAVEELAA